MLYTAPATLYKSTFPTYINKKIMKKTMILTSLAAAAVLPAMADDIMPTDWNLHAAGYNSAGNLANTAPTADNVYGWLNAKNNGWYATTGNADMRWGHGSIDADAHTVNLPNMSGTAGLAIALKSSVDLTDKELTSLTFSFDMATNNSNQTYTLWYETTAGSVVQLDTKGSAGSDWTHSYSLTEEQLAAVTADGTGELYAVFGYRDGGNNATISNISMTATTATPAIPEPATATLSLLALAGLAARRRRA